MLNKTVNSPVRWAGSKKKLLTEMLQSFSKNKKNYVEPFLGSSIVLLNVINNNSLLKYDYYYVNDKNESVINLFKLIKTNLPYLVNLINIIIDEYNELTFSEKEIYYYKKREEYNILRNNKEEKKRRAILFLFLMKAGFNGVYRENSRGEFNVPFGHKEKISIDYSNLKQVSRLIKRVKFYNLDYKVFLEKLDTKGVLDDAFIYCDPPYLPEDDAKNKNPRLYTRDFFNHEVFFNDIIKYKNSDIMISMIASKKALQIYKKNNFEEKYLDEIVRTVNPKKIIKSTELAFINYSITIK